MNNKWIPTDTYRTILENMPIACVDIAIVAYGAILLVQREDAPAKGMWWIPGGRVFKGEMLRDAAIRKARDEVGIECRVGPIIHTAETIFEDGPLGIAVHSINACFLMYPAARDFEIQLDSHHTKYKWVDQIDADLHPYVRDCLKQAGLT